MACSLSAEPGGRRRQLHTTGAARTECAHVKYSWSWLSVVDGEMLVTYERGWLGLGRQVAMTYALLQSTVWSLSLWS